MLEIFRNDFKRIMDGKKSKRTILLANLMTQMEQHYKLSMVKEIFEKETAPEVKSLYLEISKARTL